ncbi:non-ribosomal peptide synthetase, partial [Variovorax sp. MHTC-1]|uniref:non-ribosomal peptide synthetase n=1 Tax=Variovorax sp. MHTC-1 TaxID=2495593 RepID=UPI000F875836
GHSLLAIQLLERMRARGWGAQVRSLFQAPRLQAFALTLERSGDAAAADPAQHDLSGIPEGCEAIRPDMLDLVALDAEQILRIAACVPGGAANVQDIYPLGPLQEGILFHHLLQVQGDVYITHGAISFDSEEGLRGFMEMLGRVIARHDILRTAVLWEGLPAPVQVVQRQASLALEWLACEDVHVAERLSAHVRAGDFRIDVRQAPMIRAVAARDPAHGRWLLQLPCHHLVLDHATMELLVEEAAVIRQGREGTLPRPVPFRRFVAQARRGLGRAEHEAFFSAMLGDVDEPTAPFGLLDVQGDGSRILETRLVLEAELARSLRRQARSRGVSAAALFHLAWAMVLARITGQRDVVFGTVLFGRMQGGAGAERALGMFINTLPVRIRVGAQEAQPCLRQTHALLTDLLHHEHASLALAQRCSALPGGTPLFSTLLNYRHGRSSHDEAERLKGWEGMTVLGGEERTNYPITVSVDDLEAGFELTIQASVPVDADRLVGLLHAALKGLADALANEPARLLCELELLGETEQRQLRQWGINEKRHPDVQPLHRLIERQVQERPDATALVFGDAQLSYAELNARANRLAHRLIRCGVGPDVRVGVALQRSFDMVVALLAILKSGGAYVPLDPDYPSERLSYMVGDSGIGLLLTDGSLKEKVPVSGDLRVLEVDALDLKDEPAQDPQVRVDGRNLAYVIYTSGSTGRPKGAQLSHSNVSRLLAATEPWFRFGTSDVWTLFHSYAFDFSVWEMFGALSTGGKLVVVPYWVSRSPQEFLALLREQQVTVLNQTPSAFGQLIHAVEQDADQGQGLALRCVIFGGEALEPQMLRPWMERFGDERPQLVNMYGITETTVHVTYRPITRADLEEGRRSPVGVNIPDLGMRVLDAELNLTPVEVPGELHVSGDGLARGYLNRAALTAERFVADPFDERGGRLYRTGDLVKWNAQGQLEYLGRIDHQVKIRGFRIELGEIEAGLLRQPEVREAMVVANEAAGETRIVGYVALREGHGFEDERASAALRERLGHALPEYMVPSAIMVLEALPLNANGKVDRRALPVPTYGAEGVYEAPEGELEEALAAIWAEVLGIERIGRHDNFFELGGHSLKVMEAAAIARQRHGIELPLRTIFELPTLAGLSNAQAAHGRKAQQRSQQLAAIDALLAELE